MYKERLIYELDNMWNIYIQNTCPTFQDETEEAYHQIRRVLQRSCNHKKTVCINEEGAAGVLCADCGEQLEREC